MIKQYSKEMYEAMDFFERNVEKIPTAYCSSFEKEDKELWKIGHYYRAGNTNSLFLLFLSGVNYGCSISED